MAGRQKGTMYRTPRGERTLRGAERRLFAESLGMIADCLWVHDFEAGIQVFDDLQRNQRIAVLLSVSKALLRDNVPPPPLTAISEAAVAAVFQFVRELVAEEIKEDGSAEDASAVDLFGVQTERADASWRSFLRDAAEEVLELDQLPDTDHADEAEWELLIDCLRDRVLWDNDWAMVEQLDADPEQRQYLNEHLGIDEDYFVWVPPDPTDEVAAQLLNDLRYLTPEGRDLGNLPSTDT